MIINKIGRDWEILNKADLVVLGVDAQSRGGF